MAFSSIVRSFSQSPLTQELSQKLDKQRILRLGGAPTLPQGFVTTAIAKTQNRPLLLIAATLEEAGRWAAQLEAMDWKTVHFYPTSESSPYDAFDPEQEMVWGQMQVLAELLEKTGGREQEADNGEKTGGGSGATFAIVATERALQPHLPPRSLLQPSVLRLEKGMELELGSLGETLTQLGYERVNTVETEGQWSRRGDILDIFPVSSELPVRLELFGDELERLRELDPSTQRSLDAIPSLTLTPTGYAPLIRARLEASPTFEPSDYFSEEDTEKFIEGQPLEGMRRLMGLAFEPVSLLEYLPEDTLVAIDELEQCAAHSDRWVEHVEANWREQSRQAAPLPQMHRVFATALEQLQAFPQIHLSQLYESNLNATGSESVLNLASRPVAAVPHQFGRLAGIIQEERDRGFNVWLLSAQPSRSVALLQEHDCAAQFIPNPRDYPAIEKLVRGKTAVGLKYSGLAELQGFVLPTFRTVIITDREFFGQHSLATPSYIRKRRRAASQKVDPNKLRPGDFVVHRNHGVGRFEKLETMTVANETREYLVLRYEDGLLRVVADQVGALSRFRGTQGEAPALNRMSGKAWEKTKAKVRKAVKKVAVDLLKLYAERSKDEGYAFPPDNPWQQELEDSFPYQPTPDQLKSTQDVKRDMESPRPMDRLVCGDVGFGKTEVAIRSIFKAITAGKQAALLAPTTILTQQHYHTLKERFSPYPIRVGLLNRFRSATERKEIIDRLATGELDVVVGTHQLLGKAVKFKDLGLLTIDEEQRFGVNQKEKIKALKTQVDVLTLSATPIPRTLYMALSGVREMSLITTPPPSRRPIMTHLSPFEPESVRAAISQELDRGGQIFYVVPRVEGIEEVAAQVREMIPSIRIAIAHGQMQEGELEATMLTFSNGDADLMVCTTIVESGLDIPRVNTILIRDAHKFGLSQLYQLRGRVGRAGIQAHAWLFYPNQSSLSEKARHRLRAIQEFTQLGSGYQLAMRDMEIRGVGNLLGVEQSGQMEAIGFDLYMEMLQEALQEIRGQEIPQVDDTQVDLKLTAFIPADYILDLDEKMSAYRSVAAAIDKKELIQIAAEWSDRYGPIPTSSQQLLRVIELKQVAKKLGFSRIKPDGKQHIILETPMEEPAWKLLKENLPKHLQSRFVWGGGKVIVRGLGMLGVGQQLDSLIDWLSTLDGALPAATSHT